MFAVSCPHCGRKLKMKPEQAGRTFPCPACHKPVTVPAAAGDATLDSNSADVADRQGMPGAVGPGNGARGNSPSPQSPAPTPAQRFVVVDEIGRGGMGAVVRANDCEIRREVAVKYLLDQRDPQKKARFIEEAQITGQLEHPNIVPVHELGLDAEGKLYFTMKMVRGRSLKEVLDELRGAPQGSLGIVTGPSAGANDWSLSRLLGVLVNVCHALAYAHSRGVVHRDLKPANIMVGDFGEVYVMDWGLAKVLASSQREVDVPIGPNDATINTASTTAHDEHDSVSGSGSRSSAGVVSTDRAADTALTMDGSILGTPVYMPPEQAAGDIKAIDQRSDIYSLGAILYELLTLHPPVDKTGGHMAVLKRVVAGEIAPPEKRTPKRARAGFIPKELAAVAMKALSLKPADRYQTSEALRRDIELFLEGRSVSAKHDSSWELARKFVRRNKGLSFGLATALVVLLVSLAFVAKAWHDTGTAYTAYQDQVKKSVPAFVKAARLAAEQRLFDDAMEQVEVAIASDDTHADARLLKAQLLIVRQNFPAARTELRQYIQAVPDDASARRLLTLCEDAQPDDVDRLVTIAAVLNEQKEHALVDGLLRKYGPNSNEARQLLLKMYRDRVESSWPGWGHRLNLDTNGVYLNFDFHPALTDLAPLRGMPLTALSFTSTRVADLGMALTTLNCGGTRVADLSPLEGMPLTALDFRETQVVDLSPLKGMSLTTLTFYGTRVVDLSPLTGMPLTTLNCTGTQVADLSPLAGMPLLSLDCSRTQVRDLSPLEGMSLTKLDCSTTYVTDLSPIKGMQFRTFNIKQTPITSLAPLEGMPLTWLVCSETPITDLSPLKGMKLTSLSCDHTSVADLSPLSGMPLTLLECGATAVTDLSPLKGMPLVQLDCSVTPVSDLSPLKGMALRSLYITPARITAGFDVIRGIKSLTAIGINNGRGHSHNSAAEFWKKYDAGEFHPKGKKP